MTALLEQVAVLLEYLDLMLGQNKRVNPLSTPLITAVTYVTGYT